MAKSSAKIQKKVKPGHRAQKSKACSLCGRRTRRGRSCQFHKKYEG
jgi:hypothetical protein